MFFGIEKDVTMDMVQAGIFLVGNPKHACSGSWAMRVCSFLSAQDSQKQVSTRPGHQERAVTRLPGCIAKARASSPDGCVSHLDLV